MRKDSLLIIGTAAVGGAFGLFCRWLQLSTALDAETGLLRAGAAGSRILIALCVVVAALQFFHTVRLRARLAQPEDDDFFAHGSAAYRFFCAAMGALTAVGGLLMLITSLRGGVTILGFFLGLLAIFAGLLMAALSLSATAGSGMRCLCCTVPVLMLCFWLIVLYKDNASNPVIWSFCMRLLAIAASTIGWYYVAGFAYGKPKRARALFFCQLAPFLSILVMAESQRFAERLMLLCPALLLLAIGARIAREQTAEE